MKKKRRVIIYAGVVSPSWDEEANKLKELLEKEGFKVISIIFINGLDRPSIEILDN